MDNTNKTNKPTGLKSIFVFTLILLIVPALSLSCKGWRGADFETEESVSLTRNHEETGNQEEDIRDYFDTIEIFGSDDDLLESTEIEDYPYDPEEILDVESFSIHYSQSGMGVLFTEATYKFQKEGDIYRVHAEYNVASMIQNSFLNSTKTIEIPTGIVENLLIQLSEINLRKGVYKPDNSIHDASSLTEIVLNVKFQEFKYFYETQLSNPISWGAKIRGQTFVFETPTSLTDPFDEFFQTRQEWDRLLAEMVNSE